MIHYLKLMIKSIFIIVCFNFYLLAQTNYYKEKINYKDFSSKSKLFDIIEPETYWKFGIFAGPDYNSLSGSFSDYSTTCNYIFSKGSAQGFFVDLIGIFPIDEESDLHLGLGYHTQKLTSTDQRIKSTTVKGEENPVPILMEGKMDLNIANLDLSAFYRRNLFSSRFYLMIGAAFSYNMKGDIEVNETIIDKGYVFKGSLKMSDYIFPSAKIPDKNSILFSIRGGLGYEFIIAKTFSISPQIIGCYPLSKVTTTSDSKIIEIDFGLQFLIMVSI